MPNVNSWNGNWSGEGDYHAIVKNVSDRNKTVLENITNRKSHYYNFGDGWGANVTIHEVTAAEATKAKKYSKGFCGYDWMVDEILQYGHIKPLKERTIHTT